MASDRPCFWRNALGLLAACALLIGCPLNDPYYVGASGAGAGAGDGGEPDSGTSGARVGGAPGASGTSGASGSASVGGVGGGLAPAELALHKSTSASSEQLSKGNLAPFANDGDPNTRWSAADDRTPTWWRVDLGAVHRLTRVEIDFEFARPYGYLVEVSNDDVNYLTVVDRSANLDATQTQTVDLPNALGRYVRITVTAVTALPISWASFWELRVYGF